MAVRPAAIRGAIFEYSAGERLPWHVHNRGQLVYAVSGTMVVEAQAGLWVTPPQRAVWVPPRVRHRITMDTQVAMRTLYIDPAVDHALGAHCEISEVTPLLRELIVALTDLGRQRNALRRAALGRLILDELERIPAVPLHLPEGRDPRLRRITVLLRDDPADGRPLAAWGKIAGASASTLARLFHSDCGMCFGDWKRQARLLYALKRLARGDAVTTVALDAGYSSPSAFTYMFRRALGSSPSRYFKQTISPLGRDASRS
jgi:AraC-like DNA-binding protein